MFDVITTWNRAEFGFEHSRLVKIYAEIIDITNKILYYITLRRYFIGQYLTSLSDVVFNGFNVLGLCEHTANTNSISLSTNTVTSTE